MIPAELLRKKRSGAELSSDEITSFITGVTNGEVSEVQAAAFLMAVCTRGMTGAETGALTLAMRDSGRRYTFPSLHVPRIDKHSTGGVGDKLSLLLVPLVAACGVHVPMMSGRGLGHTGGTVDKLESIPGMRMEFSDAELTHLLDNIGGFMIKASHDVATADRILYALRDITGTVESTALITASILSKKLVEDIHGLVLDMKVGRGAFMQTMDAARELASEMMRVARHVGLPLHIVFTSMDEPLGHAVGNALEMFEAESSLANYDTAPRDIVELTELLACRMLQCANTQLPSDEAIEKIRSAWKSGNAHSLFRALITAQGGDWQAAREQYVNTPCREIRAEKSGFIAEMATRELGLAAITLGAGRVHHNDVIDYGAGFILHKKRAESVNEGDVLITVYATDATKLQAGAEQIRNSIRIEGTPPPKIPRILAEWTPTGDNPHSIP